MFSTGNPGAITPGIASLLGRAERAYDELRVVPWGHLDPFFAAVVQATEEAVANAMVANQDMIGRDGHRSPALPVARVTEIFRSRH